MAHLPDPGGRRGAAVLAAAAIACLLVTGPAAAADVYPPALPGPTKTTAPTDTEVLGDKEAAPTTAVLGTKVGALAFTGADVVPYLAGGGVLVAGGVGLVLLARRKRAAHDG